MYLYFYVKHFKQSNNDEKNKKVEVSELLAEIVRNSNGTVALYIFEAGSQYVETIQTQNIGNPPKQPTTNPEKE